MKVRNILLITLVFLITVFSGCGKNYDDYIGLSYESVESLFNENQDLFITLAKEVDKLPGWTFCYENDVIDIEFHNDEDLKNFNFSFDAYDDLEKCFSLMQRIVEIEKGEAEMEFDYHLCSRYLGEQKVSEFSFYDNEYDFAVYLIYSEEELKDTSAEKIADNWYIDSWGYCPD